MKYTILDDNEKYLIVDEIYDRSIKYVYLSNLKNQEDFCIKKDNNGILLDLENKEEFDKALLLFTKKHESSFELEPKIADIK